MYKKQRELVVEPSKYQEPQCCSQVGLFIPVGKVVVQSFNGNRHLLPHARSELRKVLFLAQSVTFFFVYVWNISGPLNGFAPYAQ